MLDPLLRMLVELIGDVLAWYPRFYVVFLHLLNNLDRVLRH